MGYSLCIPKADQFEEDDVAYIYNSNEHEEANIGYIYNSNEHEEANIGYIYNSNEHEEANVEAEIGSQETSGSFWHYGFLALLLAASLGGGYFLGNKKNSFTYKRVEMSAYDTLEA